MTKLLQFDPRKRITVDEAIAHPFLAPCRTDGVDMGSGVWRRDVCHFHPEATAELEQFTKEQERLRRLEEEKRRKEEEAQAKKAASRAGKSWAVSV
ncbi:CMGC/MAPK protein kinase [Phytophthora cinnamomi]|uniref:CMGC/MAPK protein kinase n=1 Tax=Phytophthora cinnamomi TaxID=4785 RepID=UPI00355A67E3|nr:CMGC/MAPK protein kinase [Phytophthora cinnamomi]